jgi:aminopeptidase N
MVESRIEVPIHWAVVHAGNYVVKEETRNGLTVRIATYAMGNERAAKELTELTFDAISFFEPFLGPFPFREFNIIQVDSYGYGQAPPGTMFITHEAFTSVIDEMSRLFSEGINERFLHEIAHQYWGNVVGWPAAEEQWLSEAFAEYSAALALRATQGEAVYKRMLNTWRTNGRQASPVSTIPLVNRISMPRASSYEQWAMRHWLLYQKGPYLLAVLHKELGDEAFLTFLKSYQASFRWKLGSTRHVVGLLKAITKKDYTAFFEDYFWGTKMPEMPR